MATIAENIQTIATATADIKDAILEKGGTITGDITTYGDAIRGIDAIGRRVTYLRRKGQGYINTGINGANSNLTIRAQFSFNQFPSGYWNVVYAYVDEDTNATRILVSKSSAVLGSLNSIASQSASIVSNLYTGVVYTVNLAPNGASSFKLASNGQNKTKTRTAGNALDKNILIFSGGSDIVDINLYYLEIRDNEQLVRQFIPHYQNGMYGLWDCVEGKFYSSVTTSFSGEMFPINVAEPSNE